MKSETENKKKRLLIFYTFLIILLSLTIYSDSLEVPFHYDDQMAIVTNYSIRHLDNIPKILLSNPTRAVSNLSFSLNYYFCKLEPFGYHLVNLFFHILNGILVYLILNLIFTSIPLIPFVSALIFVSHPINVESVTYISSRAGLMSTTFFLLSFYLFMEFRNSDFSFNKKILFYFLMIFSYILSVGSKEIGITLPVVLILYEFCFFNKNEQALSWFSAFKNKIFYLPFFAIILMAFIVRYYTIGSFFHPTFTRNPYVNFLTQINVTISYIKLLFLPVNLNVDRHFPLTTSFNFTTLCFSGIILFIFCLAFICFKNRSEISFSILWFFITISPTSVIPLEDVMSERWLYLPSIGFSIFLSMSLYRIFCRGRPLCRPSFWADRNVRPYFYAFSRSNPPSPPFITLPDGRQEVGLGGFLRKIPFITIVSALIILFFSIDTYQRNLVWSDWISLWEDTVKKSPLNARAFLNLGVGYEKKEMFNEAIAAYRRAIEIEPYHVKAHANLGTVFSRFNNFRDGIRELEIAIKINPELDAAYFNLGTTYKKMGLLDEAVIEYEKALSLKPDDELIRRVLIKVIKQREVMNEEMKDPVKAKEIKKKLSDSYYNLGAIQLMDNVYNKAEDFFKKALGYNNSNIMAKLNLGNVYYLKGEFDEAIKEFKEVVKTDPKFYKAYWNLGLVYKAKGDKVNALEVFKKYSKVEPENSVLKKEIEDLSR
ncbi:MAG: hypothetical protein A3C43_02850 [Candidatus Schekmanbacteria bacterium RIFCSPHIGHO2_02_FULL_38_11]|uniref:Uncharacterized protein n=1 Tax=Candidatus Schekmanbacteria bacterium RIFCSPLOWO2_12_FULL_38_15 TaxID=1817883 RepID=A0A1F7SIW0_9BACT|nr:MAG: hypothetical protein A3C43_02850 [Candidatus Schekmanbacteria bacterium RIFCSPHIGHO2_02_FULL_38_11]OGL53736.1 MAG: hypothetical protein A3G31_03255 [Candidatus Schekmanbacteria bacterium RIFCSPLOWO2_12_FULL_38_15]